MEDLKLFGSIDKILPLVSFYPRWVQALFLAALIIVLASVAIFVIFYSSASSRQKEAEETAQEEKLSEEDLRAITRDISDLNQLFADLGASLSAYYASATSLRLRLLDYTTKNPNIEVYEEKPLTEGLRRDVENLLNKINYIHSALSAIQRNKFAVLCWVRAANSLPKSALNQVRDSLISAGFTEKNRRSILPRFRAFYNS